MATCPECEFDEIDTDDIEQGDTMSCPECGKNLVLAANGELDFADEEDDLDDDDDEEDEEELEDDDEDDDEDDEEDDEELDE
jgi:ssDNA-binding Zn-finger/Zn-ribbon topoisomerase 1